MLIYYKKVIKMQVFINENDFDEREKGIIEDCANHRQLASTVVVALKEYFEKVMPLEQIRVFKTVEDIDTYMKENNSGLMSSLYVSVRKKLCEALSKGSYKIVKGELVYV